MKLLKEIFKIQSQILPANEIRLIFAHSLDITQEQLVLDPNRELNDGEISAIQDLVDRRKNNEPIAYLIGKKEFYGYEFEVSQDVLIPRPETEIIVDEAIRFFNRKEAITNPPKFLDLCTGSGCIGVAISKETNAVGLCSDISNEALTVARKNIAMHNLEGMIEARISSWFENLGQDEKFDLITCNPPYIAFSESNIMAKETIEFEPKLALFSGNSGYEAYEIIARDTRKHLNDNGHIILECGISQSAKIIEIFESQNFKLVNIIKDLSDIERVLVFR